MSGRPYAVEMSDITEEFMINEMVEAVYDPTNTLAIRVAACEWLINSPHPFSRGLRDEFVGKLNAEGEALATKMAARINGK